MPTFANWLHGRPAPQPADLALFRAFAETTPHWPYWSNDLAEHETFLDQLNPAPANLDALRRALNRYFGQWEAEQRLLQGSQGWNAGQIVLAVAGVVFVVAIGLGLYNSEFYASLAKTEQARGLITFLFVLSTTGVIMITIVAVFWFQDGDDIKNRFQHAKDLLTVVIGVLGTIMGFYFGLGAETGSLTIANPALAPPVAQAGASVTVTSQVLGGKGPYAVSIEFRDPDKALKSSIAPKAGNSESGAVSESIKVPDVLKAGSVFVDIKAKDSKGVQGQATTTLVVQPAPSPPPQQPAEPPAKPPAGTQPPPATK